MAIEDIIPFKDLGIGILALIIFYVFAESYRKDFFRQLELANNRGEESQKRLMGFIEGAYKDNAIMAEKIANGVKEIVHEVKDLSELQNKFREQQKESLCRVIDEISKLDRK